MEPTSAVYMVGFEGKPCGDAAAGGADEADRGEKDSVDGAIAEEAVY